MCSEGRLLSPNLPKRGAAALAGERRLGSLPAVLPHSPTSIYAPITPNVTRLAATEATS